MTKDEWLFRHSNINPPNLEQPPNSVEIVNHHELIPPMPNPPNLEQPPDSVEIYLMPEDIEVVDEITTSKGSKQKPSKDKVKGRSRRNPYKQKSLSQQGVSYGKICA